MTDERLSTPEVLRLAGYSYATLWRRIREGRMPRPVDRGRHAIFLRSEVERALGLEPDRCKNDPHRATDAPDGDPWDAATDALTGR